jgi:hypothetical protein
MLRRAPFLLIAAVAIFAAPAQAATISLGTPSPGVNVLPDGNTLTVTGAVLSNYDGEGYVVGPVNGGTVTPYTLFQKDGGLFLINDKHTGNDSITFTFAQPVYHVSFDYEIFPDGSGQTPDFTFKADGNLIFYQQGTTPSLPGYIHSPNSGPNANEINAQFIGSFSGDFPNGVTTLQFIDWPPTIGVANFSFIDPPLVDPPGVPEPPSALILAVGVLCLGLGSALSRARQEALVSGA